MEKTQPFARLDDEQSASTASIRGVVWHPSVDLILVRMHAFAA